MRRSAFAFALSLGLVSAVLLGACGSDDEARDLGPADASADRVAANPRRAETGAEASLPEAAPVDAAPIDAGPCNARIASFPILDSPHVPDATVVVYSSNPPTSGPHYQTWANFQELTHQVDDGYLVHSLEHGAVLLLYKCEGAACDAIVPALRAVRASVPDDPLCDPAIRTRVIIAPRSANDVPVAAAAWGWTYRADC